MPALREPSAVMSTDDVYSRFTARDPLLLVALHNGDPDVIRAVTRLLRLTPLSHLAAHQASLVDVLAGVPEVHGRLRSTWGQEDPELTTRLLTWAEQRRASALRAQAAAAARDLTSV
ncbi:hypothetical protein [Euzebya sp.]|uniref:hypothetical protein n=1 Tax=Euzebya sp. TaxID=1971409 RepID=UPI0035182D40